MICQYGEEKAWPRASRAVAWACVFGTLFPDLVVTFPVKLRIATKGTESTEKEEAVLRFSLCPLCS
jgi:hypothetical protein